MYIAAFYGVTLNYSGNLLCDECMYKCNEVPVNYSSYSLYDENYLSVFHVNFCKHDAYTTDLLVWELFGLTPIVSFICIRMHNYKCPYSKVHTQLHSAILK